ncbi:hypothetical protein LZ31DRAFT_545067 [Colletotrichum somersetense]|nr:hypothetical protein LZ31DRAFT_545067 [Colletotrichum somersetense]
MLVKIYSLLLASTALIAAESFTLYAYWSDRVDQITACPQDFAINARHGRFWVGDSHPTIYCPDFSGANCPPGNTTVVDGLFRKLQISKPGGQRIYADPEGVISYTPGGDSSVEATPEGSNLNAFRKSPAFGADPAYSNIYACPDEKGREYLRARWTSKRDAVWDSKCVALDGLLAHPSGEEVGAYEYTRT